MTISHLPTLKQLKLPARNSTLASTGLSSSIDLPLVVDLDGTLTPTDTLAELLIQLLKHSPMILFILPFWLLQGIAHFKARVAARTKFSAATLPYRADVLQFLKEQKNSGRTLVLATAAHESIAQAVASHLGLFDQVMGSSATCNLKGKRKLDAIMQYLGDSFVYAGDSRADLPIWRASHAAVLVNVPTNLAKLVKNSVRIEREFPVARARLKVWAKAVRVHQWVKNLLIFVPLITGFSFFNLALLVPVVLAFLAFSFAASATYIVNDLSDLSNDRAHVRKRNRPFASCAIGIGQGIAAAVVLMILAFLIATQVSHGFFIVLLTYVIITSAYTISLKEYVLIDVLMLSVLYTIRIVAGAFAIGLTMSSWLLAFSVFLFLSLALVKRCSELVSLRSSDLKSAKGRDYNTADLVILWPLGIGAALSSVVIFGLFISASVTRERYATPEILWLVALGLIYWLGRLWIKTARGEMHDDPIVYALKNNGSRVTIAICIAAMLVGHFFDFLPS